MRTQLRITGLYDQRTIQLLKENKIYSLGFDLRPRSLSFIQSHRLVELLKDQQLGEIYLQFENERDFIINDIVTKISAVFSGKIILEFTDSQSLEYYDQFKRPYILSFDPYRGELKKCCGQYFTGFTFDYSFLDEIHLRGSFDRWVGEYYRSISFLDRQLIHYLNRQWDADIFPSLYELLDFDYVGLGITSDVEVCFRNVDLKLFEKQVEYIRKHNL